ncbi:MAG: nucleotidyltransferase family protein [Oscillospiraceae bacterium]|nr:nucleotidyltransferase family protein [Oscillospiraceae bacterium]
MIAGIVCEFNPLHLGHQHLLQQVRTMGAETVVCAMSGNFVQRGEPALIGKHLRAGAAIDCGADLVLEIPTPWAMATAEIFARGGVSILHRAGCTHLAFGSESGDTAALRRVTESLGASEYDWLLRKYLGSGITFAAARQQAVEAMVGAETAAALGRPNDTLAVEYLRAAAALGADMTPLAIPRVGAMHGETERGGIASATHVRHLVSEGKIDRACAFLPDVMADILHHEVQSGTAAALRHAERAVLSSLRLCDAESLRRCDSGNEGLENRLMSAMAQARNLEEVLFLAKTKRYTAARLRRMVMWAWLRPMERQMDVPPYLRVLAANEKGRQLLRTLRDDGAPVLTKTADVALLGSDACELMECESRWSDLYSLCRESVSPCGEEWRSSPVMK